MKTISLLFSVLVSASLAGQNFYDPYANHSGPCPITQLSTGVGPGFSGEYMVFLGEHYWDQFTGTPGVTFELKIEAVSFPFTPPLNGETQVGERRLIMPDPGSYGYNPSPGHCSGWGWSSYQSGNLYRSLMRVHQGSMSYGAGYGQMSWKASLSSAMFESGGIVQDDCSGPGRTELPHTILKHTIYCRKDGISVDSLSWVYDNTRGRMKWYPFTDNGSPAFAAHHDIIFRPVMLRDPNGHPYDTGSNVSWVPLADGTANYFRPPAFEELNGLTIYPTNAALTTQLFLDAADNDLILHPAPYALLECPALNGDGNNFAGYDGNGDIVANGTEIGVEHHYVIDKPIDLRIINPTEKIVYNPSDVDIDIDGTYYPDRTLIFPSGYTFKTVHGLHPSRADVEALDPLGISPDARLAPVPSSLGLESSIYRVKDGNTLIIEPCVTIMDAKIIVEDGGLVLMDAGEVSGNYTIDDPGGDDVLLLGATAFDKPCLAECFVSGFMDVGDLTITTSDTWEYGAIPDDANSDQVLRIAGTMTVKSGVYLQMEPGVALEFGPYGRMIIEPGAKVDANGAVFSSACHNMWPGIEIWGTTDGPQSASGNAEQGFFHAYQCTFENAHCAVLVGRANDPERAFRGGVFRPLDCTFINNGLDIDIKPTRNIIGGVEAANYCWAINCDFTTNGALIDPAYHDGFGNPRAPQQHVRLVGVKGILLIGNTFTNTPPSSGPLLPHLRGSGVFARDACFRAYNNHFDGFSEAIWHCLGTSSTAIATAHIRNNTITNTLNAIVTDGTMYDEITGNTIELPPSPDYPYAPDDLNDGYNYPVGIYTQESENMHIEGNLITGAATGTGDARFSYGMDISQANAGDQSPATSLIHLNRIDGVNVAIQFEGDNRGGFDPAVMETWGSGTLVECNDFGQTGEVYNYDVAVASNWITDDGLPHWYDGLMRDQGECSDVDLQAGNHFSNCDLVDYEQWYFDSHSSDMNSAFRYSDALDDLPQAGCHNIPFSIDCGGPGTRECQPMAAEDKPARMVRVANAIIVIADLNEELANTTDTLEQAALYGRLAYAKALLNTARNAVASYILEHENLDSLLLLLSDTTNGSDIRDRIPAHIERGEIAIADSLIGILLDRNEGSASEYILLLQIRANLRATSTTPSVEQLALLDSLAHADPLGAWNAKTTLSFLYGRPYKRIPWMLNDTIAGTRSMVTTQTHEDAEVVIAPNPASTYVDVTSPVPIATISIFSVDGRQMAVRTAVCESGQRLVLESLPSGAYALHIDLHGSHVVRSLLVVRD